MPACTPSARNWRRRSARWSSSAPFDWADGLRGEVVLLARADTTAYGRVLDAYRTTRDDEEARRRKIREAQSEAADVPLSITEIGAEVAGISARLAEEGNPNLRGTP